MPTTAAVCLLRNQENMTILHIGLQSGGRYENIYMAAGNVDISALWKLANSQNEY